MTNPGSVHQTFPIEQRLSGFKTDSKRVGVDWLWYKIEKNNMDFWDHFDFDFTYVKEEDFETEEEYEKAKDEEQYEYERQARSESLPYALDDEIASALVQLTKTDPFLPEHAGFAHTASKTNWLQRVA